MPNFPTLQDKSFETGHGKNYLRKTTQLLRRDPVEQTVSTPSGIQSVKHTVNRLQEPIPRPAERNLLNTQHTQSKAQNGHHSLPPLIFCFQTVCISLFSPLVPGYGKGGLLHRGALCPSSTNVHREIRESGEIRARCRSRVHPTLTCTPIAGKTISNIEPPRKVRLGAEQQGSGKYRKHISIQVRSTISV